MEIYSHYSYAPGWIRYSVDGGIVIQEARADLFLLDAMKRVLAHDEKSKLIFCIENGLPELWNMEGARKLVACLVEAGGVKKRGHKPKKNKELHERNAQIWERVHYWHGRGLSFWDEVNQQMCACGKTAEELGLSADRVYKIWGNLGGKTPTPDKKLVALICEMKGRDERETIS